MSEWEFAQTNPIQELARLHFFSIKKLESGGAIEFTITVKEFVTPKEPTMRFFAQTDKQTNQKLAPYTPCGWGKTLLDALSECVRAVNRFPYQEQGSQSAGR
jgi:hypothetical protein